MNTSGRRIYVDSKSALQLVETIHVKKGAGNFLPSNNLVLKKAGLTIFVHLSKLIRKYKNWKSFEHYIHESDLLYRGKSSSPFESTQELLN